MPSGEENQQVYQDLINEFVSLRNGLSDTADINAIMKKSGELLARLGQARQLGPTPAEEDQLIKHALNVGNWIYIHPSPSNQLESLDLVILSKERAIRMMRFPENKFLVVEASHDLCNLYQQRFKRTHNMNDIDASIEHGTRAVELTTKGEGHWLVPRVYLATACFIRFDRLDQPKKEDIDQAIKLQSEVVLDVPHDLQESLPGWLYDLGKFYNRRYEHYHNLEDLNIAIEKLLDTEKLAPAKLPDSISLLADCYRTRFERLGDMKDIDNAINFGTTAQGLAPNGPNQNTKLGLSYASRFRHCGKLDDIDFAIVYHSTAVQSTSKGCPDLPTRYYNLGSSYHARFSRFGHHRDIDQAIDSFSNAVFLAAKGDTNLPMFLSNLGMSYEARFEHFQQADDIRLAIQHLHHAMKITPDEHAQMPARLTSLGVAYCNRFKYLEDGDPEDINKAIKYQSHALELTRPEQLADQLNLLNFLGISYETRFDKIKDWEAIEKARDFKHRALDLARRTSSSSCIAELLLSLGTTYSLRYQHLGNMQDLSEARSHYGQSEGCKCSNLRVRFRAACNLAKISISSSEPIDKQLDACSAAMDLIPRITWLGATIDIRQRFSDAREIGGMALMAATVAIDKGDYPKALEWLEQGRSIAWAETHQLRDPIDNFPADHANSKLVSDLKKVTNALHAVGSEVLSESSPAVAANTIEEAAQKNTLLEKATYKLHQLEEQYRKLLSEADKIPGFEDFLKVKPGTELVKAARTGPVVVISVYLSRCSALILQPNKGITRVALNNFSADKADELYTKMINSLLRRGTIISAHPASELKPEGEDEFEQVLADLWDNVTYPVLAAIHGYKPISEWQKLEPPHITWCPTGKLLFLPLHASGRYSGQDLWNLSDLAVSSYTPTLTALLPYSSPSSNGGSRLVAIGMPNSQTLPAVPGVTEELKWVKKHVESEPSLVYDELVDEKATTKAALDAMKAHDCVHLSCHGQQSPHEPTQSALYLWDDKATDSTPSNRIDGKLTLSMISQESLKGKGLAFLSACESATGETDLPDEAAHIAAGLLLVGYQNVVGTMWSISDLYSLAVVDRFYGLLVKDKKLDYGGAARALHESVVELREAVGVKRFEQWVPFIHFGVAS